MFRKKDLLALKIKQLELINNDTAKLYDESNYNHPVFSVQDMKESLIEEAKLFMDELTTTNDLNNLESRVDEQLELAFEMFEKLGGNNA